MAYVSQETKSKIVAAVKPIMKKYGIKGTFAVRNHSTFVFNIKSGSIDFITNFNETIKENRASDYIDVNPYWFQNHFTGEAKEFLQKVMETIKSAGEWYDRSDIMTDYFDTAFYIDINIGKWNKPYIVE